MIAWRQQLSSVALPPSWATTTNAWARASSGRWSSFPWRDAPCGSSYVWKRLGLSVLVSARENVLHLLGRREPELTRCGDLDRLSCRRIAPLARRAVLHLELAKAED